MSPQDLINRLGRSKVIPVLRARDGAAASRAAHAMIDAGFHTVEVTLTVPDAIAVIEELAARPGSLIGAGTVLSADDADRVIDAGARYVVSPCAVDGLVALCRARNVGCLPGAMTPSEILAQSRSGATAVKVFPARAAGGAGFLRAVKAVFPAIPMIPTGGIGCADVEDYLAAGALAVGMGSELLSADVIAHGSYEDLRGAAAEVIATWAATWNLTPSKEISNA
ncbi:MAG: bifunctional 4-hydroxy-2-oxoglutarate aldolase/2-dehydro-3-deoxy-phosphogluconate aldolase [Alphaproteobacteria bacterium]|nr:bifunctional 4-hydroxy-2-oxoglutarate aldolase/2-dehydro-3-deoxy-phosphogluconate aldolase [Alphaproteobacteria bacterium]